MPIGGTEEKFADIEVAYKFTVLIDISITKLSFRLSIYAQLEI